MPDLRLIRAEILKLRRRPGLVAATGVLAFASAVAYFAVLAKASTPVAATRPGRRRSLRTSARISRRSGIRSGPPAGWSR